MVELGLWCAPLGYSIENSEVVNCSQNSLRLNLHNYCVLPHTFGKSAKCATPDFREDDGYQRMPYSNICQKPSGEVPIRDGLVIACFVLGLLTLFIWVIFLIFKKEALNDPDSHDR